MSPKPSQQYEGFYLDLFLFQSYFSYGSSGKRNSITMKISNIDFFLKPLEFLQHLESI